MRKSSGKISEGENKILNSGHLTKTPMWGTLLSYIQYIFHREVSHTAHVLFE